MMTNFNQFIVLNKKQQNPFMLLHNNAVSFNVAFTFALKQISLIFLFFYSIYINLIKTILSKV